MKTLEQLRKERETILDSERSVTDKRERAKLAKHVAFLNPLITYLEHSPAEQSLRDQLKLANKKLDALIDQVNAEIGINAEQSIRTKWLKKNGADNIRKQIVNLEYLLE